MAFDIVGSAYDIVGADGDFSVGARGRRPSRGRAGAGGRFAGMQVQSAPDSVPRVLFIGFPTFGSIAAAGTATQTVRPQKPFRPDRLIMPVPGMVVGMLITVFTIGSDPVFANAGGEIDASAFFPTAVATSLAATTAYPGIDIVLTLVNSTAGAIVMRGVGIVGVALDR